MTTPNINIAAFIASGSTAKRSWLDRCSDVINVLDYFPTGVTPDGITPVEAYVQAALDAAFGSSSTPNGVSGASQNRPVFFPNGNYLFNSTINLTRVVGGHIFGAGTGATVLTPNFNGTGLYINGAVNLVIERFTMSGGFGASSVGIDLDWDGTPTNFFSSGLGLRRNVIRDWQIANVKTGIKIAKSGNDGSNNLFQNAEIGTSGATSTAVGMDIIGTAAINNQSILGGCGGDIGYYCRGGSIHIYEPSLSSQQVGQVADVQVDSGYPVMVIGGRTESSNFLLLNNGVVALRGVAQTLNETTFATLNGGKLTIDACGSNAAINGSIASATSGTISGTTFTAGGVVTGTIRVGQYLKGSGIPTGSLAPYIVSGSGTTWTLNYAPGNISVGETMTCGSMLYIRCFDNAGNASYLSGYNGLGGNADHTVENF